jgi:bifunctional non-homologous end joining protein LigD
LAEYQAKRDFAVSPEPKGGRRSSTRRLTFCVQKHLARSLHYDLRLEHESVLLSWAVPKGPSLNPSDKRFAARTEDHPLEYGDFEGVIPEGYGAGLVMLWDRGTWTPESGDVEAALKKGELKFSLDGVKLKGSWVLVRTRPSARGAESWLLIKHRDKWSGELDVTGFAPLSVKSFGDFTTVLRDHGIPSAWRTRLPVHSGETAMLLREIVRSADTPTPTKKGRRERPARATKLPAAALRFESRRPKLTNLTKKLYPSGFTKGNLIDYYTRAAPLILPHLAGRAVTLKRYPDGIDGKAFFHKRCPEHRPPWVKTVRVTSEAGESIDFCSVGDISTLVWLANLAAIELHVPLALASAPDTPTAMIFDLDPGEPAGLAECVTVARRARSLLSQIRLNSFAKLSGKKGLHVVVPLNTPAVTFDQTKTFAKAVAQVLARDDPKHITAIMQKDLRPGKVFIDWGQNDRSKTTVCAYSLRAESRPSISLPIDLDSSGVAVPFADSVRLPEVDPMAHALTIPQELPTDGI